LAIEHLALYPDTPLAAVERVKPLGLDHSCRRCPLSGQKGIRTVCVPPEGDPGGLLLVGEMPGRDEDLAGRPMIGTAGGYLRRLVSKLWAGPVAFDNGLRCHGVMASDKDRVKLLKYTDACRGFMAQTLLEVQPERVVALGSIAAYSLLGRAPPMMSVRRGYGWLMGDTPTPVYLLSNPAATSRNRFIKAAFEADLHWALTSPIPRPRHQHAFATVLSTVDEARRALASLDAARYVLFDVETAGLLWEPEFTLLCVAFASVEAPEHVYVFDGAAVEDPAMREELRAWVTTLPLAGQHVKFDVSAMACALGVDPLSVRIEFDTGLVRALLDSGSDTRLEVVTELVGMGGHKEEADELIQSGAEQARAQAKELLSGQGTLFGGPPPLDPPVARGIRDEWPTRSWAFATVPRVPLLRYNARDTMSEALLAELLEARLAGEPNLTRVWQTIVKDIIPTFACMEQWGIGASRSAAETLARWCDTKQRAVLARFQPYNIHPGSRDQVAELLFKRLGLPSQHATKTGKDSTDADALESMRGLHPVIEDMLVWRKYEKLRGTYADGGEAAVGKPFKLGKAGLVQWIRSDDRVHPSIKPHGTETGRPSCEKPNLMNIPRAEDEEGVMARNCFAAEAGWTLVEFDQSQIELRVMASQSGDKKMIDIFRSGVDFHYRTAQLVAPTVWRMKPEDVPKKGKERSAAKTVNFAVAYGKHARSLACDIFKTQNPTDEQVAIAQALIDAILGEFSTLNAWLKGQITHARKHGFVWVPLFDQLGRRRYLHGVADQDDGRRGHAERAAMNSPVQGGAAELTLASLTDVVRWVKRHKLPVRVGLTVYDSIVMEVRNDFVATVLSEVPGMMTRWKIPNGVPLVADAKVGQSWGALEEVKT